MGKRRRQRRQRRQRRRRKWKDDVYSAKELEKEEEEAETLLAKQTWTRSDLVSAEDLLIPPRRVSVQTDVLKRLRKRLVMERKFEAEKLLAKGTWNFFDFLSVENMLIPPQRDLLQTDVLQRLHEHLVKERTFEAEKLLAKETWTENDFLSAQFMLKTTHRKKILQTDISQRLRQRQERYVKEKKFEAAKLLDKETWNVNDFLSAQLMLKTTPREDLLQTAVSQRLRQRHERYVKEKKFEAEKLLAKEIWTENDFLSAQSLLKTTHREDLLQTDVSQRLRQRHERYVKEKKVLVKAEKLLAKETWANFDLFEAKKLLVKETWTRSDVRFAVELLTEPQRDLLQADVSKCLRERLKRDEPEIAKSFESWRELSWEAQERQRQGTLKKKHDSTREDADEIDKVPEEIGDDPYTRRLYTKALKDGKETNRCIRINVVGNFSQGKTTLVRRLVGQSIDGVETTNGIDIDRYRCKESQDGNLYCEKTNNDDNSCALHRLCLIASSLEPEEVEHIGQNSKIDESSLAHENENHGQPPIDFEINDEFLSFLHQMQSETRAEVVKTENKIPATFDIWDFGGQYIFYATHTLFHSRNAIYLLVMDVSLGMGDIILNEDFPAETGDRNVEYFIKFWMNSIHSFVGMQNCSDPPVILVGTHKDEIPGNENAKQQCAETYFENVRMLFDNTDVLKHIHSKDFTVDNMSLTDTGVESLRKEIITMGTEKAEGVQIPAKWIPLEEALHKRRNENLIPFDEVKKIDAKNALPLVDEEQIKLFLQYHHSKGTLFYFDEEPVSEYVVINPQYLIDAFKCIITSERFCKKDPKIRPLWSRLVKEARLENDLIDFQWRKNEDKQFMTNRTILLSLLKKHHIISEAMNFDEQYQSAEGLGWYIVPSLLKNRITQTQIKDFLQGKKQTIIRIALRFENSAVIPTICHRLFAATLSKWCVASFHNYVLLFEDFAVFRLDMFQVGIIRMNLKDRTIELQVLGLGCSAYLGDTFRRFTEAVVNHEFRKFNTTEDLQTPYQHFYRCNHKSHGIDGSDLVELSHMESKHNVPCPDLENHTIPVVEAKAEWFLEDKVILKEIPKKVPSEKQLSKISTSVGENWEILGAELGLTEVQINHLNEDNRTAVMKRFGMLLEWRKQKKDRATMDVLVEVVKENPHVQIDWDIIRNIIDEMKEC